MKNIMYIIVFILFCLAGIAGIQPWHVPVQSVGYFNISKNPYGVAIYQDGLRKSVQFAGAPSFSVNKNTVTFPTVTKILYSRDDIIFDTDTIFTEPTQEQIDFLKKTKIKTTDRIIDLPQTVYLVNPHIPGELEIYGSNMQIDLNQKQITGIIYSVAVHDDITI